jgi:hypothetical protein
MTERRRIILGIPHSGGPCMTFDTARAIYHCSKNHDVKVLGISGPAGNFNQILAWCLNAVRDGEADIMAMLHTDIEPQDYWVDILEDERQRLDADMVSALVPIKDTRIVSSSGIREAADPWLYPRVFTMAEAEQFPETFNAADVGYPGGCLLHNNGCWIADLRRPVFHQVDDDGLLIAMFDFRRRIRLADGKFVFECEGEDWLFSRKLYELGATTYVTRKVSLTHEGSFRYPCRGGWGVFPFNTDTETRKE